MLLLIAATFSHCFPVTSSCKGTRIIYGSKKVKVGDYEFITLGNALASLGATGKGLWVLNSVDPCVLKSNYYLNEQG